jgi:nucleoside-triphosphatase THEP1
MPKIQIHISGDYGAGKSAIAQFIANKLGECGEAGFEVTIEGAVTLRDVEPLAVALKSLVGRTKISIREVHPAKPFLGVPDSKVSPK